METHIQFLLALGGLMLLGLATDALGRRTWFPRVTLLLIFGAAIGKEGLDLIPPVFTEHFDLIANMALLMIGFLLGGKLTQADLKQSSTKILAISLCASIGPALLVTLGLLLIDTPLAIAILVGFLAAATAPAATVDCVMESGFKSPFADLLLAIVALDDVWALILFGFGLAFVAALSGIDGASPLVMVVHDIGGAVLLGIAIGLPAAYLTGRLHRGQPVLVEALGLVFVCGGFALWLDVSYLIAAIVMGAVIANLAKHHDYPFHAIEGIEWPFMIVFFALAGASLEWSSLQAIGWIGLVYVICRTAGKYFGALLGGTIGNASRKMRRWMGLALLPQAGVATGMALVASGEFPQYRDILMPVAISTTVLFELFGPVATRYALRRTGQ